MDERYGCIQQFFVGERYGLGIFAIVVSPTSMNLVWLSEENHMNVHKLESIRM